MTGGGGVVQQTRRQNLAQARDISARQTYRVVEARDRGGRVQTIPGGFVMISAQLRDSSADAAVLDTTRNEGRERRLALVHPRGPGFRTLSRLARHEADEETGYAPRHRVGGPCDESSVDC